MSEDLIRYDILAQEALRGVVKTVLTEVARTGLPGDHHFYITFLTKAPGVHLSPRLLEKYPEDMTIVVQHQFWDLQANDQAVEIGLSFDGIPEKLYIPYSAIITFIDPSVHFSLQFQIEPSDEDDFDDFDEIEEEEVGAMLSVLNTNEATDGQEDENVSIMNHHLDEPSLGEETDKESDQDTDSEEAGKTGEGAEVVSLDSFRKK